MMLCFIIIYIIITIYSFFFDIYDLLYLFVFMRPFFFFGVLLFQAFNWVFSVSGIDSGEFDEAAGGGSVRPTYQVLFFLTTFYSPSFVCVSQTHLHTVR